MFKITVVQACGQGGQGDGRYFVGRGVGFSKSPRKALRMAQRQADAAEGMEWIPVYHEVTIERLSHIQR